MNQERYGKHIRQFRILDITKDELPRSDIILCRDCLVHFPFKKIVAALRNFKRSDSSYLLTTTFPQRDENRDILTGHWRPINLELPPFDFPKPIKMINEKCTEEDGRASDKVWVSGGWKTSLFDRQSSRMDKEALRNGYQKV